MKLKIIETIYLTALFVVGTAGLGAAVEVGGTSSSDCVKSTMIGLSILMLRLRAL